MMDTSEPKPDRPLDDAMVAMDVAAMLGGDLRPLVDRTPYAKPDLIEHLRELYRHQGIEVSERAIATGIDVFEGRSLVQRPSGRGLELALARLYVARHRWITPVAAAVVAATFGYLCLVLAQ